MMGSTDYTEDVVQEYLTDERIKYTLNERNSGLGYSLNSGLQRSSHSLIAYLPSDDIYFEGHLQSLYETITSDENAVLAYSGMLHGYVKGSFSHFAQESLSSVGGWYQLVHVVHRRVKNQCMPRETLVTDNLNKMYWDELLQNGNALPTNRVTYEWISHPEQRHRLIKEISGGGIYTYKLFYKVEEPIRFHSSVGNSIDEISLYAPCRQPVKTISDQSLGSKSLKILLVGELAYNVSALSR